MSVLCAGERVSLVEGVPTLPGPPRAGGALWSEPGFFPSPRLLQHGQALAAAGGVVSYHPVPVAEMDTLPPAVRAAQRVIIAAPGPLRHLAERVRAALSGSVPAIELLDPLGPFDPSGPSEAVAPGPATHAPGYGLAHGHTATQAEIDVVPAWAPVHPSAHAALAGGRASPAERTVNWADRLTAAADSLAGTSEGALYLNDHRVPTTMDRLRTVAAVVRRGLKEHHTLLQIHLRAWPQDLISDGKLLDHLNLLPLASLDVLAGASLPDALRGVLASGLSHLSMVSLVVGLPGETSEQCLETINRAIEAAVQARVRRLRLSLWLGDGAVPVDSGDQDRLFLAAHPDWHPMEYRGLFDFVALLQAAMPQLVLIGPGFVPGWEPAAPAEGA